MQQSYRQLAIEFKTTKCPHTFAKLYTKIKPRMRSFVLGIVKDPEAADDIVSDAMTSVFTKIDQYNPEYQITTWSYTIAYNCAIQYLRDRNKKVSLSVFQDNGVDIVDSGKLTKKDTIDENLLKVDFSSLEDELVQQERILEERYDACVNAINELPSLYKEIMVDRFIKNMSYNDIEVAEKERFREKISQLEEDFKVACDSDKLKIGAKIKSMKRKTINGQTIKNRIHRGRKIIQDHLINLEIFKESIDI